MLADLAQPRVDPSTGRLIPLRSSTLLFTVDLIRASGLTVNRIATGSGVSHTCIDRWLDGTTHYPRLSTIERVLDFLGYDLKPAKRTFH